MVKHSELTAFLSHFRQQSGFNDEAFLNLVEDTNETVTLQILARFQKTLSECENSIRVGIEKNDRDLLWKTCHKIAGSAELLGFRPGI
jgi:HPt (histidine-containing phosphotransfer) domain-containing protein